jgi:hypothetical protein
MAAWFAQYWYLLLVVPIALWLLYKLIRLHPRFSGGS